MTRSRKRTQAEIDEIVIRLFETASKDLQANPEARIPWPTDPDWGKYVEKHRA